MRSFVVGLCSIFFYNMSNITLLYSDNTVMVFTDRFYLTNEFLHPRERIYRYLHREAALKPQAIFPACHKV